MGAPELNFSRRRRLPMIMAAEAAECGLACLAMVAGYHGHEIDINGLRQRFALSLSGTSMRHMMGIADQLDLAGRAVRLDLNSLPQLQLPAILHWDLKHFVVLKSVNGRRAIVHDPAGGVKAYSLDEMSAHFTGVALELRPTATFEKIVARVPVRLSSLWSRISGLRSSLTKVVVLSLALQLVTFALPLQSQLVIDQGILRNDGDVLLAIALGFAGLVALQSLIEALRAWTLQVLGQLLSFQMVSNIFRHMIRLPSDFFAKRQVGDIISRVGSATTIQEIITKGVVAAVIDSAMSLIALAAMYAYSPALATVVLLGTTVSIGVSLALLPLMRRRMGERIVAMAREQSHVIESVRAATTIKVMGREAEREGAWRNLYASVINASVSVAKYEISLSAIQSLLSGLQIVLVLYLAAKLVMGAAGFTLGMMFAFFSFRQTFSDRAGSLMNQTVQFRLLKLHLERIGDIIGADPEPTHSSRMDGSFSGDIHLSNVSFRYGAADPLTLKKVELRIDRGDFVAITGRSGSGKSTLLKVMLGLRNPLEGAIFLDGSPATPELWRAWRQSVGVVAQDDRLISGSIAENIGFFDPELDMRRVEDAAIAANIHADVQLMPMQYYSHIGDMGSSLSGGQKQRILLARALYRKPSILFLDEGTANLDDETEKAIADLVSAMDITRVVIAHRPALVERAKRIFVMKDGQLHEEVQGEQRTLPQAIGPVAAA